MSSEPDLHFYCQPAAGTVADASVQFVSVTEFLSDESGCKGLWQLIETQFNTRSKFLAIWRCVSFVLVHRKEDGSPDGYLLISAPVNWQIDYVVVHPDSRGQGIARKLVNQALAYAGQRGVPYVMLTSKESLRTMYEGCGFRAV